MPHQEEPLSFPNPWQTDFERLSAVAPAGATPDVSGIPEPLPVFKRQVAAAEAGPAPAELPWLARTPSVVAGLQTVGSLGTGALNTVATGVWGPDWARKAAANVAQAFSTGGVSKVINRAGETAVRDIVNPGRAGVKEFWFGPGETPAEQEDRRRMEAIAALDQKPAASFQPVFPESQGLGAPAGATGVFQGGQRWTPESGFTTKEQVQREWGQTEQRVAPEVGLAFSGVADLSSVGLGKIPARMRLPNGTVLEANRSPSEAFQIAIHLAGPEGSKERAANMAFLKSAWDRLASEAAVASGAAQGPLTAEQVAARAAQPPGGGVPAVVAGQGAGLPAAGAMAVARQQARITPQERLILNRAINSRDTNVLRQAAAINARMDRDALADVNWRREQLGAATQLGVAKAMGQTQRDLAEIKSGSRPDTATVGVLTKQAQSLEGRLKAAAAAGMTTDQIKKLEDETSAAWVKAIEEAEKSKKSKKTDKGV